MNIFYNKESLISYQKSVTSLNTKVGFVPTMGAIHDGHLSLMNNSLLENEQTVVSIFVNPTQFNNPVDLEKYPRNLEKDVERIGNFNSSIIIYAPTVEDIYGDNIISQDFDFDGLENQMEGRYRPGHFNGVGTIVKRLFEIVNPTNAYFGEKDFQQLQIIRKLVEKNNLKTRIVGCPIYREKNNLAMSSRNELLSEEARETAAFIYITLREVKSKFVANEIAQIVFWVKNEFERNKMFSLEYFEIADEATLFTAIKKEKGMKYRAFIAVFIENVRLIDTMLLN